MALIDRLRGREPEPEVPATEEVDLEKQKLAKEKMGGCRH